jgi:phosphatidylserine decarboxylase
LDEAEAAVVGDVPTALAAMNDIVKTMKQTIESGADAEVPTAAVAEQSDELASLWKAVETQVRAAHEAYAAELEAGIIELAQAIREQPIDPQRVIEADYRIYQVLRDVSALFERTLEG